MANKINMKLSQKFSNHFKPLIFHLVGTTIMVLCLACLHFQKEMIFVFEIIWIIYTLPVLYLHLEYYLWNWNLLVDINDDSIKITKNGKQKTYPLDNLSRILVYKSASLDNGGIQILPLESYFYAKILTKHNEVIIITCLICPNLEDVIMKLNGIPYERKKKIFCSINSI